MTAAFSARRRADEFEALLSRGADSSLSERDAQKYAAKVRELAEADLRAAFSTKEKQKRYELKDQAKAKVKAGVECPDDPNEQVLLSGTFKALESSAAGAEFVLGSAIQHPHDLVLGRYSVHTNREALQQGEATIKQMGVALAAQRRLAK